MNTPLKSSVTPGVLEISQFGQPVGGRRLLLEIPHGATERLHFDELASRLHGPFPAGLEKFFHVNTDVAAPELAQAIALDRSLEGVQVTIVRSLIPRTFIDCNRTPGASAEEFRAGGVTPATPSYVRDRRDLSLLEGLLGEYRTLVDEAYRAVCGEGGFALMLHTYAPRSVPILAVGDDIVEQLERHYAPGEIGKCPERPEIDFITRTPGEDTLVDLKLVERMALGLRDAGRSVAFGESYPLHPSTSAYHLARRYRGNTLCLEVRRDLLVEEWKPFEPMSASREKLVPIASAIARAVAEHLEASN